MIINCTFKLVYTCNTFSRKINFNCSIKKLKELIKNDVLSHMNVTNFNIILAGTQLGEKNDPLDCAIDNVILSNLIPLYGNTCTFYIKELCEHNDRSHEFNNCSHEFNNCSILLNHNNDCPVCYSNLRPIETITLGCNHKICRNCISSWFRTGSISCPYCRS
jgi:hypothetical protein